MEFAKQLKENKQCLAFGDDKENGSHFPAIESSEEMAALKNRIGRAKNRHSQEDTPMPKGVLGEINSNVRSRANSIFDKEDGLKFMAYKKGVRELSVQLP